MNTEQAWYPTLATNAVIAWTATYQSLAVEQMRRTGHRTGRCVDDEILTHINLAYNANITFIVAIEAVGQITDACLAVDGGRSLG